jgi:hypothetical protein
MDFLDSIGPQQRLGKRSQVKPFVGCLLESEVVEVEPVDVDIHDCHLDPEFSVARQLTCL